MPATSTRLPRPRLLRRVPLPPPAAATVLAVAEREQAERDEEKRQEEDVAAGHREHDHGEGQADSERAQHLPYLVASGAAGEKEAFRPRARRVLLVAADRLLGVASARELVARSPVR